MAGRLLLISERFPPDLGGVARSAERIAGLFAELDVDCHVLTWTKTLPPGQLRSSPAAANGPLRDVKLHRFGLFANWDLSLQHSMNVMEWLDEQHPFDAIWGHYLYPAGFVAVLVARSLGRPSIVSARGNDVDRLMFPPGDFARLTWTIENASRVTAVSRALADKIDVLSGSAPSAQVQVVHNSVDAELFKPGEPDLELRQALGIDPRETVLGFCGELRHKKGLPFLLQAYRELAEQRPVCLLIIGQVRQRDEVALFEHFADQPHLRDRMIVTGDLPDRRDVADHLRLCDLTLQPSVWDGLPNAVLESMACGQLVVASDAGGIPEVIEHARNGFLVPRAQLHRLGEAVQEVLSLDEATKIAVARQARQRVVDAFQPSQEAATLDELFKGVIASTSR